MKPLMSISGAPCLTSGVLEIDLMHCCLGRGDLSSTKNSVVANKGMAADSKCGVCRGGLGANPPHWLFCVEGMKRGSMITQTTKRV